VAIDARTSDAIALAIRYSCPIFTYEDILARAGIDTRLPAEPQIESGHLRHVGKRAKKIARQECKVKIRRAIASASAKPALGQESKPRRRARKIAL